MSKSLSVIVISTVGVPSTSSTFRGVQERMCTFIPCENPLPATTSLVVSGQFKTYTLRLLPEWDRQMTQF